MLCFGGNEAGRADTARMWTMLQPGERMTACGLILPGGANSPWEMVEQGRVDELAGCLMNPKPLYECVTDTLAERVDFSKVEDQAMFLQRTQQDVIDLLPDGMKERAAIYVDDTLEQETAEAGAEDRLHAALPAMGPETVTPGPELG